MEVMYYQLPRSSCEDSLKVLESDLQHANALAASIPRAKGGSCLQMKLVYNNWAPLFLFVLQWLDCSCSCRLPRYISFFHILVYKVYTDGRQAMPSHGRKASVREFYAVILPYLQRLHGDLGDFENKTPKKGDRSFVEILTTKKKSIGDYVSSLDMEREDECGICLEPCTKMVLPNCCHAMCIKCYRNWNSKSKSCPFCRGSMKRVNSEDLWVLTHNDDVVDNETVTKEELLRFYLYINSLPKVYPDALFLVYYEYLI